jgi:dipeptidyl aminopeptidase/acylaminoacyl peptidase
MLENMKTIIETEKIELPVIKKDDYSNYKKYYDYKYEQWDVLIFNKITYLSDGLKVKGVLIEPKHNPKKLMPCLIYNRGGSGEFGTIDEKKIFNDLAEFASWGYVVIASQYRGNDGSEGKDEYCGSDINDIINLKKIIDEHPYIDTSKIFMFGASRGGLMTYKVLSKVKWVSSAVIKAGSADEIRGYEERPELKEYRKSMYDVNSEVENIKRSPLKWNDTKIKTISTPILLLHGTKDTQVNVLDSLEMAIRLQKNNIPFEMHILMDDDHRLRKNKLKVESIMKKWFAKYESDN